jgi:hypothetical protein
MSFKTTEETEEEIVARSKYFVECRIKDAESGRNTSFDNRCYINDKKERDEHRNWAWTVFIHDCFSIFNVDSIAKRDMSSMDDIIEEIEKLGVVYSLHGDHVLFPDKPDSTTEYNRDYDMAKTYKCLNDIANGVSSKEYLLEKLTERHKEAGRKIMGYCEFMFADRQRYLSCTVRTEIEMEKVDSQTIYNINRLIKNYRNIGQDIELIKKISFCA